MAVKAAGIAQNRSVLMGVIYSPLRFAFSNAVCLGGVVYTVSVIITIFLKK